jgi:hypothetical protein
MLTSGARASAGRREGEGGAGEARPSWATVSMALLGLLAREEGMGEGKEGVGCCRPKGGRARE